MQHLQKSFFIGVILFIQMFFLAACSHSEKGKTNSKSADNINVLRISHPERDNEATPSVNKQDSWEGFNRGIYRFNKGLDNVILKPVAKGYKAITPNIIDQSITNVFSNLGDVGNAINNLLQFKPKAAINDSARFMFNSTFGLAGLLDIASEMELEKHDEDFGQTLAKWGVGSGPYIMLPVLGPSTVRDAGAKLTIDGLTDPLSYMNYSVEATALKLVDKRADLLSSEEAFKDLSKDDEYAAIRDAWLQRREYLIRDGKVDEENQSDMIDELESLDDE